MADTDLIVLEDAEESAFMLDKAYRKAIMQRKYSVARKLKPKVASAYNAYSEARLTLLEEGIITSKEDVIEMRLIKAEIDDAANTQQMVIGAVKLITKLASFV